MSKKRSRIITDNTSLYTDYQNLKTGDVFVGSLRLRPGEEYILLDLAERGVRIIPPALAQMASRSKTFQVRLFHSYMVPHTLAIYTRHDLLGAVTLYQKNSIRQVVTKHDRRNAGLGIYLWPSAEEVYTQASFGVIPFPFVLQPFVSGCRDIRVVMLGDYVEAYWRHNPFNFRNNLHHGGKSSPCDPSAEQLMLCRQAMKRGLFPYAHLDIMITADNSYLAEINLRGGLKGARIRRDDYRTKIEAIHMSWLEKIEREKQQ